MNSQKRSMVARCGTQLAAHVTQTLFALLCCVTMSNASAETAQGRVTFVGTLDDSQQPTGAPITRFRFRLSESSCGTTDGLWGKVSNGTAWTSWRQLASEAFLSRPAAVTIGNVTGIFVLGTDNRIYTKSWDGTTASGWTALGTELFSSAPTIARQSDNRLDLFARGMTTNTLWWNRWSGTWSGWTEVGPGTINSDPAAVSWGPNRVDVFVRRPPDDALYQITLLGNTWTNWVTRGGQLTSGAAVTSWAANRIDVFARGTTNTLFTTFWDGAGWSGWNEVSPQQIASDPAASTSGVNQIDVYAQRSDKQVYVLRGNGLAPGGTGLQWSGWTSTGNERLGSAVALARNANQVRMLARGSDRADRWFFATTTRPDSVNFRNAYNTLLTGLLARTVVSAQVDAIPNCDEVQVQPFAIENSQVALYP